MNDDKIGVPGAFVGVAFFAMIAVGLNSCFTQPEFPVLNCPDGFAPKYYHWSEPVRAECVKVEK